MIIPVSNAYGSVFLLGSEINVSNAGGDASFGIGNNEENEFPTGADINSQGMYMAWLENLTPDPNGIKFSFVSTSAPITPTTPVSVDNATSTGKFFRNISTYANGNTVDIVATLDNEQGHDNVVHYRSLDNGVTWGSQNVLVNGTLLDSGAGAGKDIFWIWSDVEGNDISVFYRDVEQKGVPFINEMTYVKSTDAGATTQTPIQINPNDTSFDVEHFNVVEDGSNVHVAYINGSATSKQLVYHRSTDNGASFASGVVLSSGIGAGNTGFDNHMIIATDQNDVTILFVADDAGTTKIGQVRSNNNGATWNTQEVPFDGSVCDWDVGRTDSEPIVQHGQTIQVICAGNSNANGFTARSTDMGANWSTLSSFLSGAGNFANDKVVDELALDFVGNSIYIYWSGQDTADTPSNSFFNAFVESVDGGTTWSTIQLFNFGSSLTDNPFIKATGVHAWAGFEDQSPTEIKIRYLDKTIPVITPKLGIEPIILQLGQAFSISNDVQCIDVVVGTISFGGNFGSDNGITVDPDKTGLQTQRYFCKDSNLNQAVTSIDFLVKRPSSGGSGAGDGRITGGQQSISQLGDVQPLTQPTEPTDVDRAFSLFDTLNSLFDFDRPQEQVTTPDAPTAPTVPAPTPEPDQRDTFVDRIRDFFSSLFG